MSGINIQEIFTSDNIKQFMEKCNENFAAILQNGGGPRGRNGNDGATGATGKRGNMFHFVQIESETDFNVDDATAAISEIEDIENGDFVLFAVGDTCCYIGCVECVEESEGYVPMIMSLVKLQGPQGDQGEAGSGASDQFDANEDYLILNESFHHLLLPNIDTSTLDSQVTNALCLGENKGIGFISNGREKSGIGNNNGVFKITTDLDLSVASKENISIGKFDNGAVSKNITITGGQNIIISRGANSIKLDNNNIKVFGNTKFNSNVGVGGEITSQGSITSATKVSAPILETNKLSVTNLGGSFGSVQIDNVSGLNVGNGVFKVDKNKNVIIGPNAGNVQINRFVQANVPDINGEYDFLYLGIPRFTFVLYPVTVSTPDKWEEFKDIQIKISNNTYYRWIPDDWSSVPAVDNFGFIYFRYGNYCNKMLLSNVYLKSSSSGGFTPGNTPSLSPNDQQLLAPNGGGGGGTAPSYRVLIQYLLTRENTYQDMTNIFTYELSGGLHIYTLSATPPLNMFKWIFKYE